MATTEQIVELRRKISEQDETTYTDVYLGLLIDDQPDLDLVAAAIWEEKAAAYAELVDISEAGSSRKNGQLYKNALDMAAYYHGQSANEGVADPSLTSGTRRIVRL